MKLISPFTIFRDALKNKTFDSPTCFIDETQVGINECGVPLEDKREVENLNFWDVECEEHPTNSHCKVYEE